ncbi:DMT family transporter [Lentzea sp.]|uniref:DMT family transporter n=1 Tax=Lentzea sp. TaxID=56099 RepID=UPI002D0D5568|nr:DMT family transporter [Lentzea sp.]HUQ59644.1 DMT family transporter [Lentzea sp.]
MNQRGTLIRMGVLALLWGSSFLWMKLALGSLAPLQISLVRTFFGALVLFVVLALAKMTLPRDRRIWGHMTFVALFGSAIPFTLFAFGGQTVDSGVSGVLNSTTPLFALAIGLLLGTERISNLARMAGLALGFGGVLLIFAPWQAANSIASWGAVLCLIGAASYAIGYSYAGRYLVNTGATSTQLAALQLTTAMGMLVLALPFGGLQPLHLHWIGIIAVTVLGVFGTGAAFILNYRVIADEGATTATTVGYLLPVVSVLLGAIFLGEQLNARVVVGMLVVLVGVALTRRKPVAAGQDVSPNETRDLVKR